MIVSHDLDGDILNELRSRGACSLEQLTDRFSAYTWNQIFWAVDRLSRESRLAIWQPAQFQYLVAIHPVAQYSGAPIQVYQ